MQLVERYLERLDHRAHELGEYRGPVGGEERVERSPDPVVVQRVTLTGGEPEQRFWPVDDPLGDLVSGRALDDEVSHQHEQRGRGCERRTRVRRHVVVQERFEAEAREELVHDRQRTDPALEERCAVDVDQPGHRTPLTLFLVAYTLGVTASRMSP